MSWNQLETTFDRARRKEAYRRLGRIVTGGTTPSLLPLDEVRDRLRLFHQSYGGIRAIPVARIVGSVERAQDFSHDFLPRRPELRARWRRLEQAFRDSAFPPIQVYELGGTYFVIDGHLRVAIARQRELEFIDAEVTVLHSRIDFPSDVNIGHVILAEQERIFMEESALERARPEARVEFTRPEGYPELLEMIRAHGYYLIVQRGELVDADEIAGDWYDWVYLPTVESIKQERLNELIPHTTDADLFLIVWQRRRSLFPERGDMSLEDAVRAMRDERARPDGVLGSKARKAVKRLRPDRGAG